MRTRSPTSNVLPARLEDLAKVSEVRLGGRAREADSGGSDVLGRPTDDDVEATEGDRPTTDLRPDSAEKLAVLGERLAVRESEVRC